MKCATCTEQIKRPPSLSKGKNLFCNHHCYAKFKAKKWATESNPRWKGGNEKLICIVCSKEYERKRYGKRINKYCSIKCATENRDIKGEKHWNWKGGNNSRYAKKKATRPKPGKCEICNSKYNPNIKIVCDHNHKTGKFRGWLCSNCNTALGLVKEDTKILESLSKYLNENCL